MSRVPDGPLHDFGSERAHARAEAIDMLVERWSQDADAIAAVVLRNPSGVAAALANSYELGNEECGARMRQFVNRNLVARAERELDA